MGIVACTGCAGASLHDRVCVLQIDPQIHSLILNTGINKRFRYGAFSKDPEDVAEAEEPAAKKARVE